MAGLGFTRVHPRREYNGLFLRMIPDILREPFFKPGERRVGTNQVVLIELKKLLELLLDRRLEQSLDTPPRLIGLFRQFLGGVVFLPECLFYYSGDLVH